MSFLVLDPRLAAHLIEGEVDELTPASTAKIARIKGMACKRCGSSMHPRLHDKPFVDTDPLPRMVATCECGYTVDPDTGLVIELGSAAKVTESIPIIKTQRD
jgi:hypothetical protein